MMIQRLLSLLFVLTFSAAGFSQESNSFDYGSIKDSVYTNEFFQLKLLVPKGWFVQEQQAMKEMMKRGQELVAGDNEQLKAIIKASEVQSATLLAAFQHKLGTPVAYNPSFLVITENVAKAPGIKTGSDYLFHTKKLLENSAMKPVINEIKNETIGNNSWGLMEAKIKAATGLEIQQEYRSLISQRFAFNVVISYTTEEEHNALLEVLKSMSKVKQ